MIAANPPPDFARRELQKILQREGPMVPRQRNIQWDTHLAQTML